MRMNSVPVPGRSPCLTCKAFTTIPPPSTPRTPDVALARYPSAHRAISRLRLSSAGSPVRQAESSSLSCGLVVHLLLLPTPPRGDAVTVDYRPESVCLKGTSTPPTSHAHRRTEGEPPARPYKKLIAIDVILNPNVFNQPCEKDVCSPGGTDKRVFEVCQCCKMSAPSRSWFGLAGTGCLGALSPCPFADFGDFLIGQDFAERTYPA
jgi:hypothetical protein